jgi:polysaccharide export outer membrane protein
VVPVRPDGRISLPLVNDVAAVGLTPMQLRSVLQQRLASFIPNAEVSVIVKEVNSARVSVFGEVVHPGRYEIRGPTTVLDVLALAGGVSEFASAQIFVLRQMERGVERIPVDRGRLLADGAEANVKLRPGDIVVVP